MIETSIRSDDFQVDADFDATSWFEQACNEDIMALIKCGWGGDYPADVVAEMMVDQNPAIGGVLDYVDNHPEMGFEVHVDPDQARDWVRKHRPELLM